MAMTMATIEELTAENHRLRERLGQLSEASMRCNESLDYATVLQGVIDASRVLTGARYGGMLLYDETGWVADYVSSGPTAEQAQLFWTMKGGMDVQRHLSGFEEDLRISDFYDYAERVGLPEVVIPFPTHDNLPFLGAWVRLHGERVGAIYLCDRPEEFCVDGYAREFTEDDLEVLVMLASQAALVISNARRHRDEQRARARMETLVDMAPVGVLVFAAPSGTLVSANREARRIFGDELSAGTSADEALLAATRRGERGLAEPAAELLVSATLESGEAVLADEVVVGESGGRPMTVLVNATPVRDVGGPVGSVVVTAQDMSRQDDAERLRAEFLGMVGHELRMPVTSIKGSAAALLAGQSSLGAAEMAEFFRIIDEQADYMQSLIADLIDVVRIETGTLSVVAEPVDVRGVIDEARNTFLAAGGRDNIRINLPSDLPPITAERRRVVQVLTNLLSNAERNSHDTSRITVAADTDDVYVSISVADEGRGLAAERIPHLFEKFRPPRRSDRGTDLGLGLAICKGIVEAHGGRIRARSDGPGLGSRFEFTVPVADTDSDSSQRSDAAEAQSGRPSRVLVLDDDPRILKLVRDTLEDAGHQVTLTGDPTQLGALISEVDPHLLVLDMMLPGTDGIELMQDVLGDRDTPVIFLSAYDRAELIANAFEMGAVDYITKPFAPTELAARVKAALRKKPERSEVFTLGELVIDYADRSVTVAGRHVELTPLEYGMLAELSTNAGAALTHDHLLKTVWGPDKPGNAGLVRTVAKSLRQRLGDPPRDPKYIYTVSRIGYRIPKP